MRLRPEIQDLVVAGDLQAAAREMLEDVGVQSGLEFQEEDLDEILEYDGLEYRRSDAAWSAPVHEAPIGRREDAVHEVGEAVRALGALFEQHSAGHFVEVGHLQGPQTWRVGIAVVPYDITEDLQRATGKTWVKPASIRASRR